MKLFDATVTQTVLGCTESWVMTGAEKRMLKSTKNCMLRRILGTKRAPGQTWVDWMKSSTQSAREKAHAAHIRFWVDSHLKSKWAWAGHIQRMACDRLARRATVWRDSAWWHEETLLPPHLRMHRSHRRYWLRWEDDLKRYAAHRDWPQWQEKTKPKEAWLSHQADFARFVQCGRT